MFFNPLSAGAPWQMTGATARAESLGETSGDYVGGGGPNFGTGAVLNNFAAREASVDAAAANGEPVAGSALGGLAVGAVLATVAVYFLTRR